MSKLQFTNTHLEYILENEKIWIKRKSIEKTNLYERLALINTPHLKRIENITYGDEYVHYQEEYIDGETLVTKSLVEFDISQINHILLGVLEAIRILHSQKIIHRDVTPANILLTRFNSPVLIDYNIIVEYNTSNERDNIAMGTRGHAAPEQYGFSTSIYETDIFNFGSTFDKVLVENRNYHLYKSILKKCQEFDPKNRYQNILEIQTEIRKIKNQIKNPANNLSEPSQEEAIIDTESYVNISDYQQENQTFSVKVKELLKTPSDEKNKINRRIYFIPIIIINLLYILILTPNIALTNEIGTVPFGWPLSIITTCVFLIVTFIITAIFYEISKNINYLLTIIISVINFIFINLIVYAIVFVIFEAIFLL